MLPTPVPAVEPEPSIWSTYLPGVSRSSNVNNASCNLVVGIDFGTSNSSIAIWRKDISRVKVIKNSRGEKTTPTQLLFAPHFENFFAGDISDLSRDVLLHFDKPKELKDGPTESSSSKREFNMSITQRRMVSGLKNLLGLRTLSEIQEKYPHFPYELDSIPCEDDPDERQIMVVCEDTLGHRRMYSVVELISFFLSYLRQCAIDYLQKTRSTSESTSMDDMSRLNRVVLGIPAHFPEAKKDSLKEAAFMAGFDEIHFMIESTAASLAYGLLVAGKKRVMVFDMGGGTTDISILDIQDGKHNIIHTSGHSRLGGQDFDQQLLGIIQEKLSFALKRRGIDITGDIMNTINARRVLLSASKQCKESLSTETYYEIHFNPSMFESMDMKFKTKTNESVKIVVNRDEFVNAVKSLIMMVQDTVEMAIEAIIKERADDDMDYDVVDEIVLIGGSSRIPVIQDAIRVACEKHGIYTFSKVNKRSKSQHTPRPFCTSISPEHAVVEGLAIKGAIIAGEDTNILKNILMMDCLPTSIGIISHENGCKIFEPILLQGSRIPCQMTKIFQIANDFQRFVSLEIYEEIEESSISSDMSCRRKYSYDVLVTVDVPIDNHEVDRMTMQDQIDVSFNKPPRFAEVTFKVDEDGQLTYDVCEIYNFCPSTESNEHDSNTIHVLPYNDINKKKGGITFSASTQSWVLIWFIVVLLTLYITLKLIFPQPLEVGQHNGIDQSLIEGVNISVMKVGLHDKVGEMDML